MTTISLGENRKMVATATMATADSDPISILLLVYPNKVHSV